MTLILLPNLIVTSTPLTNWQRKQAEQTWFQINQASLITNLICFEPPDNWEGSFSSPRWSGSRTENARTMLPVKVQELPRISHRGAISCLEEVLIFS